jgi:hypothetical protein
MCKSRSIEDGGHACDSACCALLVSPYKALPEDCSVSHLSSCSCSVHDGLDNPLYVQIIVKAWHGVEGCSLFLIAPSSYLI